MKKIVSLFMVMLFVLLKAVPSFATDYYVDATLGKDTRDGLTENTAWQTINKVNTSPLSAGDRILFKRGEVWRGTLVTQGGNEKGYITYSAYGKGDKPLFLGSISRSKESDWLNQGNNIWVTNSCISISKDELLPDNWRLWSREAQTGRNIAKLNTDTDGSQKISYPADVKKTGNLPASIQLIDTEFPLTAGKIYKLRFRAKCTKSFRLPSIYLMKKDAPYGYVADPLTGLPAIQLNWDTYEVFFKCNTSENKSRITFFLGGPRGIPLGAVFNITGISLREIRGDLIFQDVGNIIFNNGGEFGVKIFPTPDLNGQNRFWYDPQRFRVMIYSKQNPALRYQSIELALNQSVINIINREKVIVDGLACKFGGVLGINSINVKNVIIRNCDISYIGGSIGQHLNFIVRYGNGIQFWGDAVNCTVENCRVWEIYDAGITNQNQYESRTHKNIIYRNNLIWNCEQTLSCWNKPEASILDQVTFENNICVNAGTGWGHDQRYYYNPKETRMKVYDPTGIHLNLVANYARTRNILIRNNIFYYAKASCIFRHKIWNNLESLALENNFYYQPAGKMLADWGGKNYYPLQFDVYQTESKKDTGSTVSILTTPNDIFQPIVVKTIANSAMIIWMTEIASDSQVDYGPNKSLILRKNNPLISKTHMIELTELKPGVQYSLKVSGKDIYGGKISYPEMLSFVWNPQSAQLEILQ